MIHYQPGIHSSWPLRSLVSFLLFVILRPTSLSRPTNCGWNSVGFYGFDAKQFLPGRDICCQLSRVDPWHQAVDGGNFMSCDRDMNTTGCGEKSNWGLTSLNHFQLVKAHNCEIESTKRLCNVSYSCSSGLPMSGVYRGSGCATWNHEPNFIVKLLCPSEIWFGKSFLPSTSDHLLQGLSKQRRGHPWMQGEKIPLRNQCRQQCHSPPA